MAYSISLYTDNVPKPTDEGPFESRREATDAATTHLLAGTATLAVINDGETGIETLTLGGDPCASQESFPA